MCPFTARNTEADLCPAWLPRAGVRGARAGRRGGFLDPWGSQACPAQPELPRGCRSGAPEGPCLGLLRMSLSSRPGQRMRARMGRGVGVFPGSQTETGGGGAVAGTAEEERGSRDRHTQPVFFGEAAESEFQEPITLVETSFLWPGRVTWLGGDQRQAGPRGWAGSHPGSQRRRPLHCPRG